MADNAKLQTPMTKMLSHLLGILLPFSCFEFRISVIDICLGFVSWGVGYGRKL